jgi:hypothetical protein
MLKNFQEKRSKMRFVLRGCFIHEFPRIFIYGFADLTNLRIITTTDFYLRICEFNGFTDYYDYFLSTDFHEFPRIFIYKFANLTDLRIITTTFYPPISMNFHGFFSYKFVNLTNLRIITTTFYPPISTNFHGFFYLQIRKFVDKKHVPKRSR